MARCLMRQSWPWQLLGRLSAPGASALVGRDKGHSLTLESGWRLHSDHWLPSQTLPKPCLCLQGGNLRNAWMRPLPELKWGKRGWLVALDVARGLHHLHTNKVIHCDLKTSVSSGACLSPPGFDQHVLWFARLDKRSPAVTCVSFRSTDGAVSVSGADQPDARAI